MNEVQNKSGDIPEKMEKMDAKRDETDDDEDSPVLSCPFCQIMFDEKADNIDHVSLEHNLEVGGDEDVDVEHIEEQQEESEFCFPICEEKFVEKEVVLS